MSDNLIKRIFKRGIVVVLPIAILIIVFYVLINFVLGLLNPFTQVVEASFGIHGIWADVIFVGLLCFVVFFVGILMRTRGGLFMHEVIKKRFLRATPVYKIIKKTTDHLMSGQKPPFSKVALVKVFDAQTLM